MTTPDAVLSRALAAHEQAPARSGAHLADAAFRFDTEAVGPSTPRPREGERWTLAQTLQEIRLRRAVVTRTTGGVRVAHAHRAGPLAEAVAEHAHDVGLWLDLGAPGPVGGWDDEAALQIRWFESRFRDEQHALALRPGVSVTDWPRFRESVLGRFGQGPDAPCAAGLRRDLADLYAEHARPSLRRVQVPSRAKAA